MWKTFLLILLTTLFAADFINAKSVKRQEVKDTRLPFMPYDVTSFDYDYNIEPRRVPYQRHQTKSSPTTTPRPLMSYWQNIVRNVRLPMPSITWNVTNPLANLFHVNTDQIGDPYPSEDYYSSNSQRRHKHKRRRKQPHHKRNKKHKQTDENVAETQPIEVVTPVENQIELPHYPITGVDPNEPMYFYDPNTDAYYAIQRVRALGSFIEGNIYNPNYVQPFEQKIDKTETMEQTNKDNAVAKDKSKDDDDAELDGDSILDEAAEIDFDKLTDLKEGANIEQKKQEEKPKSNVLNEETLRNMLGAYMLDDRYNRQRQRAQEKRRENHFGKQHPRDYMKYLFLLDMN